MALAKKMRRRKRSLREISAALAEAGHVNEHGKPFAAMSNSPHGGVSKR